MTNCTYFVEGLCEKQLIDSIKNTDLLIPGKVKVFNVVQADLKPSHLLSIRDGYIVFVFDTDVSNTTYLWSNIKRVKENCPSKVKLLFLAQAKNFEEEIVRATEDKKTSDLTSSKSNKDFKRDFILLKDLPSVLRKHCFDINKMWRQPVPAPFCQNISNNGAQFVVNKKRKAASL